MHWDDISISQGSFMRTKYLFVMIHIRIKGEIGTVNMFKPSSDIFAVRDNAECGSFLLYMFHVYLCYAVLSVPCSLVITCCERADILALLRFVFACVLSLYHMLFRVRYGTWLYRFLIFAFLSTLRIFKDMCFNRLFA